MERLFLTTIDCSGGIRKLEISADWQEGDCSPSDLKANFFISAYQQNPCVTCWHCMKCLIPKISDFGAVDDVGKRPISLWHKQTPGIPGVDFHPRKTVQYSTGLCRFQKWPIRTPKPPSRNNTVPNKDEIRGVARPCAVPVPSGHYGTVTFPIASVRTGSASRERDYIGTLSPCMERSFCRNLYYVQNEPDFDHRPVRALEEPRHGASAALEKLNANKVETDRSGSRLSGP